MPRHTYKHWSQTNRKVTKRCKTCGKKFSTVWPLKVYCTPKCSMSH